MFNKLGQIASFLKQLPKLREEMDRLQERLKKLTVEGDAGAGMVKVRVNGKLDVLSCTVSDELMKLQDKEMLEDLVRAATNQALDRARQLAADETSKMASLLGVPADVKLPEFGGEE
jgi:DNA-binding YbaB/EbfC family protein